MYEWVIAAGHYDAAKRIVARRAIQLGVDSGRIVKPFWCPSCGAATVSRQMHAHHIDYELPVCFKWMCFACHKATHRALKESAVAESPVA